VSVETIILLLYYYDFLFQLGFNQQ
jgi:hypothetical protein